MIRSLFLLLPTLICTYQLAGQTFHKITALSGTQTVGGKTVIVTSTGSPSASAGITGAPCATMEYRLTDGYSVNGSFTYSFSTPVHYIRFVTPLLDSSTSTTSTPGSYDEISFILNGNFYTLSSSQVTTPVNSCGYTGHLGYHPLVINGKLTATNTIPLYGVNPQVDIQPGFPINTLQIVSGGTSAFVYSLYFADTGAYVNQPFVDTIKCPGDSLYLPYGTSAPFNTGNVFTAQLSNASGSFASPVTIGTTTATGAGTIACKIPQNIAAGSGYRVRIVSNNPVRTSVDNGKDILIKAGPTSPAIAGSNSPLCAGSTLSLTCSNAGTGLSYSWSKSISFSANTQNTNIPSATTAASGDYIVTALAAGTGCSTKDTVTVLVKPMPAVPTAGNNTPICSGSDLDLTASSTTTGVSYNWTGPFFTNNTQNPTRTAATTSMSGTYSVTATLNGCTSAAATTQATVNLEPTVPSVSSNSPVCGGGNIDLIANSTTPGVTYNWSGPNGYTATGATPTIAAAALSNAGNYSVTATLGNCTSSSATTNVVVNVVSTGGAYASPNDTICPGGTATFVVMPQNAGPSPSFQWCKNGNVIPGATNKVFTTKGLQDRDSVYCRMIVTNVCASALTIYTNAVKMAIIPGITVAPVVTVTSAPAQPIPGQPVTFNAVATSGGGMSPTYQWQRNGLIVSGATNATFSVSNLTPGEQVSCIMTSSDVCASVGADTSNIIVASFPTYTEDINAEGFNLYPNPNKGSFTLTGNFNQKTIALEVLNAVGQTVYKQPVAVQNNQLKIEMPDAAKGVYLIRFTNEDQTFGKRFTIQ